MRDHALVPIHMNEKVFVTEYPVELAGKVDPQLFRRLQQIYQKLQELSLFQREVPVATQRVVRQQLQLLGVLREPLVGQETPDPNLSTAATVPGTVTDLTGTSGSGNITVTVTSTGPGNSGKNVEVSISDNPTFSTVDVTGHYEVDGVQVVADQQAAIPDAAGGVTVDAEARAAINALLAAVRTHGLIDT